jgi:hypothetical protein
MVRGVAAITIALAGCVVHVDYSNTRFRCDDGVTCPGGFHCVDRTCEPDGADLAVTGDGGDDLAGPADLRSCGATQSVVDNFDLNTVAPFWSAIAPASESGGLAVVPLPSPAAAGVLGEFRTISPTDLRGSHVYVAVIQPTNVASHARTFLRVSNGSDVLAIVEENGMISFHDGATTLAMIPYDNVTHRWWQLREQANKVYFETSLDGSSTSWTIRAMTATPSWAASVIIELGAETYQSESSPGTAQFDNLNGGGPATGPAC